MTSTHSVAATQTSPWSRVMPMLRHPLTRHAVTLVSALYLVWVWQFVVQAGSHIDAEAYWRVDPADPYAVGHAGAQHAFLYAPVVAQFLGLINWVPSGVCYAALAAISIASLVYLVGPRWAAAVLLIPIPPLWQDLLTGNIHLILAAVVVVGFRHPAAWSLVLLTKLTPGVGLVWFAVRREWRALMLAMIATGTLVVISLLITPHLWAEWTSLLLGNATTTPQGLFVPIPLALRLLVALALVAWGARAGHRWTLPAAAFLSLPIIWLFDGFALLVGVAGVLYRSRSGHQHTDDPSD
jgi:hypothetical protein